ncbi:unnamed protein product, partial [Mesorhabditis belari]|uniref:PH domain-containing protein n=1 Tax=Mesorhabditis belari TaxID=2138241 RepID=A0AAF3FQ27_9BILA
MSDCEIVYECIQAPAITPRFQQKFAIKEELDASVQFIGEVIRTPRNGEQKAIPKAERLLVAPTPPLPTEEKEDKRFQIIGIFVAIALLLCCSWEANELISGWRNGRGIGWITQQSYLILISIFLAVLAVVPSTSLLTPCTSRSEFRQMVEAKVEKKKETGKDSDRKGILRSLSFQFSNLSRKMSLSPKEEKDPNPYDSTPEDNYDEVGLGPLLGVQCFGILQKKYKKKNRSATWNKRFFVLKECFLMYYPARLFKEFEKTKKINLHPKGVIPLIGCSIVSGGEAGRRHCLLIAHPQFPSALVLCAHEQKVQDQWLKALRSATKISYKNTIVGESMIRELESRGMLLNEEKKGYEERLREEAEARQQEHDRVMELAKVKEELEAEREKLIRTTKKLKDDLQSVKNELKITNETKRTLESEKLSLNSKTEHLVASMESLNIEKEKIQEQLTSILREREQFLLENQNLATTTCQLKNRLMEIETKTSCITHEKDKIEQLLRLNEQKTADLEKERQYYTSQTKELICTLKEVSDQKEMTESELKDQMMARIGAERQLQAAEKALEHLEMALKLTGAQMTELQEHIMPDVHKLREFFEACAEEARLEANKTGIMRNAIYARKSMRRRSTRTLRSSMKKPTLKENGDKKDPMTDSALSQL